jgi:hypothetical protein
LRKVNVILAVKCRSYNVIEENRDFFIQADSQNAPTELPTWEYKHRRNIIRFDISVKMPNKETLKYVIRYMDSEKRSFRLGLLMRILNMVMLVLEPWFAARIIAAETGVSLYALDMAMSGDSYFEAMYHNIDTIKEALG